MGIVIFSGTSEGRKLSEYLSANGIGHEVCVATKSGEAVMEESDFATVNVGRLNECEIRTYLMQNRPELVIDATHPYAEIITDNLRLACMESGCDYLRVNREISDAVGKIAGDVAGNTVGDTAADNNAMSHESAEECARVLLSEEGNIFLTTGSKELACYMQYPELRDRVYVRVLPTVEAISLCSSAGINEKHIIAMYGPHTKDINEAILKQYNIRHLVTKESGSVGGFREKADACMAAGVKLHILERPQNATGISVEECIKRLDDLYGINIGHRTQPKIHFKIVGIGPGNKSMMTLAALNALSEADYVFGATRMLEVYMAGFNEAEMEKGLNKKSDTATDKTCSEGAVMIQEYMPDKIVGKLEDILAEYTEADAVSDKHNNTSDGLPNNKKVKKSVINIVALYSGDTGLYSGASGLYKKLMEWGKCESLEIIPGISSFSAFSAFIGTDYRDACLESLHGKSDDEDNINKIAGLIADNKKVYLIMSGKSDFDILERILPDDFNGKIIIGYNISYENQRVIYTDRINMKNDIETVLEGLFIVLVEPEKA